ncbi:hypothetical protein PtA15_14A301 [Puccinia triticina]|uniref:Transfer RNA methyltransferase 82 n=1 Tax=Puccinia triticina TaxID=208348 RepID=A0ABY7D408_9BASI|nr:uncharacterized protein PtA15_14A301 [Puccinia triticina]WAQ91417.1 hypothetical protein PtA15_14A301 [Puccinia triticina]
MIEVYVLTVTKWVRAGPFSVGHCDPGVGKWVDEEPISLAGSSLYPTNGELGGWRCIGESSPGSDDAPAGRQGLSLQPGNPGRRERATDLPFARFTRMLTVSGYSDGETNHIKNRPGEADQQTRARPTTTILSRRLSAPAWIPQAFTPGLRSAGLQSLAGRFPSRLSLRPASGYSHPCSSPTRDGHYLSTGRRLHSLPDESRSRTYRLRNNSTQTRKERPEECPTMAPKLPAQQLAMSPDKSVLVLAISSHLQLVDRATGTRLRSTEDAGLNPPGSNHTGLIRLLLIHQDLSKPDKPLILVSTGEDKLLKTWQLPALKLLHSRQLIKRATSIAVSPNGKNIVIADKFGDVYDLPFDAPSQTVFQSDPDQDEAPASTADEPSLVKDADAKVKGDGTKPAGKAILPIAGHVSVLTALTFIPSEPQPLLVTADRDEHVRLSRYPQAWSIERYLLGHRKFVGALLWLPHPTDPAPSQGRLLSAGGDDALFVWHPLQGRAAQTVDLAGLAKGLKVCPAKQTWFAKARTNKRRRPNPAEPPKTGPAPTDPPAAPANPENTPAAAPDEDAGGQEAATETAAEPQQLVQKTCVNKIIYTSPSDLAGPGYVLVTSVGSSTIAYIPLPRIFAPDQSTELAQNNTRYIDLDLPVLDIAVLAPDLVLVSLDASFPADPSRSPPSAFRTLSLTPHKIEEVSDPQGFNLKSLNESCSIESSSELAMPSQELLYPELLLFTKDTPGSAAGQDHKAKHAQRDIGSGGRSGKKGEGRLVSQARCEIVLAKAAIS